MKKILSILVMVLFGVSGVWAADGYTTIHAYAMYDPDGDGIYTEGGGTVQAFGKQKGISSSDQTGVTATYSKAQGKGNDLSILGADNYYVEARVKSESDGYYFSAWYSQSTPTERTKLTEEWIYNSGELNGKTSYPDKYAYAIFKPVSISTFTPNILLESREKEKYVEKEVTFNVVGADAINDFKNSNVTLLGDSRFSIPETGTAKFTGDKSSGIVTVTIRYTDDNHHILNAPLPTATLTLTSAGGENTQMITITATSDLKPYFTVAPSLCDFTPNNPLELGAAKQGKQLTITPTANTALESISIWSVYFKNPADASEKGYEYDATDPKNPIVYFTPQDTYNNQANIETILCVKCVYTDATPQDVPYVHEITLSADVGKVFTINALTNAIMNFDVIDYSEVNNPVSMEYPVYTTLLPSDFNVTEDLHGVTYTATIDGEGSVTDKIIVTAQSDLTPNEYTSTLVYDEIDGDINTVLTIKLPIQLAKPIVTATNGKGQAIQLSWQNVFGATEYIVKSGETVLTTIGDDEAIATTYTVTNINGATLSTSIEYPFTVTAVYGPNNFGNRTSDEIKATPSMPTIITPEAVATLQLYTGTDMFVKDNGTYGKYPYREKKRVDLSTIFNNNVAAFDQLFIFGLTTNSDALFVTASGITGPKITVPSIEANSNAVTPCYIYTKSGNDYMLSKTIPNVNIAKKPTEFNITDMSKSYYFTGYAPYASCGSTWEENAVFLFTSSGNSVNLYFDNLELYARPKAAIGKTVPVKQYTVNGIGEAIGLFGDPDMNVTTEPELALEVFVQGSGAAFAFASTSSTEFKPTIHLRGTNILESTAGASVRVTSSLLSMDATASQQSSPIQVLLKKDGGKNSKTNLTITDTWADGTTCTNGILDLANLDVRPAPTIDLGNANTTLNFNGGQYFLSNAANTSTAYTVSFAISYRKKSMASGKANMFGLGDDQPEGKVRFNDGSVNCSVLPKAYFNENLYHNQTSMKCPQDTKIDGGTFNCDVLSCASTTSKGGSPTNTAGQALCIVEIPIASVNSDNGTAVLANDWMTYAFEHGAKTNQLGYYGIKSMQPTTIINDDEEEVSGVRLMLPSDKICFMEMVRIPWVLCTPDVTVKQTGVTQTLGGNKTVESSIAAGDEGITNVKLTARLLYAELDDYTKNAIADYTVPGGYEVTIAEKNCSYVTNANSYLISDKIYWVRPVVANQWQMIVPPFDVANIYIVESYPEEQLLKDFGTRTTNKIGQEVYVIDDENKIDDARIAQAKSMMDLVYYWMYDADPAGLKNDNDLWPKKGWDMSKFVREWVDYEVSKNGDNKAYQPIIEQLYHFTGSNWDANYYLYESSGEWVDEGDKFVTDWQLVPTQSVKRGTGTPQTIMHKGGIYAMSFPYSIYNDGSHDPEFTWDYWTGKYIIMEGYPTETNDIVGDVQVLSGTNTDWDGNPLTSTVLADFTTAGRASLRGNSTFGELTVPDAFVLPAGENTFRRKENHPLAPGEGFIMLANAPATPSPMPRRIASIDMMTGDVTYEPGDGSENTVTGTPTISGDRDMLVYTFAGGLGVVPVVPQYVSIYNTAGQLVVSQYLTDDTQFALPTGIYLVRGEKDQAKAMVK